MLGRCQQISGVPHGEALTTGAVSWVRYFFVRSELKLGMNLEVNLEMYHQVYGTLQARRNLVSTRLAAEY